MVGLSGAALAEALGATLSTVGTAVLAAAVLLRFLNLYWVRAAAICVVADERTSLRWYTRSAIHEEAWPSPATPPAAGTEVTVYYHARRPNRWSLRSPHRPAWVLLVAGAVLVVASWFAPLVVQ